MWGSKWWAICFEESIFSPDFPDSNKCGVPSDGQFDKSLGQHSIVILFGVI